MIVHPAFHNVAYKQAEQVMASMDVGDCIIRPSSKVIIIIKKKRLGGSSKLLVQGNDHLTVTWKVDESLYQHIDIQEKDKENPVTLGNRLVIGDEVMTSLSILFLIRRISLRSMKILTKLLRGICSQWRVSRASSSPISTIVTLTAERRPYWSNS